MTAPYNMLTGFAAEIESGEGLRAPSIEERQVEELCAQAELDIDEEIEAPPVALFIGDSPACTFGNFSASIGKPKGKKTFNVSAMVVAALINSRVLLYRGNMPAGKNRILYFDTEQSRYHAFRVFRRIVRLSRLSNAEVKRRIRFMALRRYSVDDRIRIIDHTIRRSTDVGLVVIDGIRDLMQDINNPRESTVIVNYLMNWTEELNLHIHTIIHQNKGDDNARGHIGTEINNKAETVLKVDKDKTDDSISTVEAVYIRDITFPSFAFQIDQEGLPVLLENHTPDESQRKERAAWEPYFDISEATHRSVLSSVFPTDDTEWQRGELMQKLTLAFHKEGILLSNGKVKKLVTFYINKRMIEQIDGSKKKGNPFRYLPDFKY